MVMVIIFILKATWSSGCDTNDELLMHLAMKKALKFSDTVAPLVQQPALWWHFQI